MVVIVPVKPEADDGLLDGEGHDGDDEIGGLLKQGFGRGIAGVDICRIQTGQQEQQDLRAKVADGEDHRILCKLLIFIQNENSFLLVSNLYYNRFQKKMEYPF